jgi:5-methylcytosine-specific restriction endonuclease McrA
MNVQSPRITSTLAMSPRQRLAVYRRLRRAYMMHHGICEFCRVRLSVVLHHVKPVATNPELELDASNFKALCRPCHAICHAKRALPRKTIRLLH